jgi:hypothetical protein
MLEKGHSVERRPCGGAGVPAYTLDAASPSAQADMISKVAKVPLPT